ncbi:hypothetical protein LEP1GSC163_0953 [Leptospira santarosai str. CBC379]|uniref:Uncharacterized protein n=1 Tax=Leptospira santarosai str. MOR084 TaxID=1049984 RepID=A0A0E2BBZ7_9LEPT|nr:hypothetical protein [Leptospira santarosai]EKO32857.1 hypothetical protein LEP1GSC179_2986 [Leptospira santarosai str. MOR084]EKR93129.1 hypothetical protein LEP1GSC163_0953 [Leptospira santarosai str. CBC379]
MDNLSGIVFPSVGKRVFPEDWKKEQEAKGNAMLLRDMDAWGSGIDSGGTIVVGSGVNHVDLTDTLIAYDEFGKRVCIPPITNITTPNNVTCTLVVRHRFQETPYDSPSNLPSDGPIVWRDDSYEFICRQGSLVSGDIPLRSITTNGSGVVTLGNDLRVWRGIKGNRIKDGEVTETKQATSVKTGLVTDLHADLIAGINPDTNNPLKFVKGINQVYLFFKNFIDVTFKQERKFLGEMFWMDDFKTPSTDFPAFCLAAPDQLINASGTGGMPDLVSYWLNIPFRFDPLGTNVTDFDAISYSISSNVLTVTFANTTACQKLIDALVEDNLVQGSFTNWMTGTLLQAIGGVPANATLAITALSSASRTISFTCAAANSSGSLSVKVRFYKHRLPDITAGTTVINQVRHFAVQGRGFVSVMDSDSEWIGGLRRRDRFQGHVIQGVSNGGSAIQPGGSIGTGNPLSPVSDGTNGNPRMGKTTDARGLSGFPYVFAKRVL